MYIMRWLAAPVLAKSGSLITKQGKGTPQGGVISPLLANLFLHYGFDKWLEQSDTTVNFTRYADDVIVHCRSKQHAEQVLRSIEERMNTIELELHPVKTKIGYLILPLAIRICLLTLVFLYNKSCMMGDYHVRFCEGLRVGFALPTRSPTLATTEKNICFPYQ